MQEEATAASPGLCGLRTDGTVILRQWGATAGLRKGNHVVKSVLEKTALATFLRMKPRGRGLWGGYFRSFLETGRFAHDKRFLLPVRPRYRREVEGQRLSAKADDKVCCFSPVRRSMTYQMSCFLPETTQGHTVVYTHPI